MQISTNSLLALMLAASAAAAPQVPTESYADKLEEVNRLRASGVAPIKRQVEPSFAEKLEEVDQHRDQNEALEKRQIGELIGAGERLGGKLMDRVFDILEGASSDAYNGHHVQDKATNFGCVGDDEKKVGPNWLMDQAKYVCDYMTSKPEGTLISTKYQSALMGLEWPARQDASENQHEGDWVDISLSWSKDPKFTGTSVDMTASLCKDIIDVGLRICQDGSPRRSRGFSALFNVEWVFDLDVTNTDDGVNQGLYPNAAKHMAPYGVNDWDDFVKSMGE